ncbi:MAG: phosphoribosylaminoimidazolesuccinocarboxamide synthase [Planctomycetota bacterium]
MAVDLETLRKQLPNTLESTSFPSLGEKYEGKVRDCYVGDGRRTIVVSDRISAFDVVLGTLPFKGQVLNQIAQYWFDESKDVAPNHMLDVPDANVMVGQECRPLKAEFVMRSYLTGVTSTSIWQAYKGGARTFCGHDLPEGMSKNQKLPHPILTPSTKAEKGGHDVSVSREELIELGHISAEDFDKAAAMVHRLFEFGVTRAAERGLILVDTKYEIGVSPDGEMMFIDEIHTPDSSRYWYAADYEKRLAEGLAPRSLDKEYLRLWMSETHGYTGEGDPPALTDEVRVEAAKRCNDPAHAKTTGVGRWLSG